MRVKPRNSRMADPPSIVINISLACCDTIRSFI